MPRLKLHVLAVKLDNISLVRLSVILQLNLNVIQISMSSDGCYLLILYLC